MWMPALVEVIRDVFGISNDSDVVAAGLGEIRNVVGQIRAASATNVDANVRRQWAGALKFCFGPLPTSALLSTMDSASPFRLFLC